jgi:hypothetical protein
MSNEHDEGGYTDPCGRHQEPSEVPTKIVLDPSPRTEQLDRADEAATESLPTAGELPARPVCGGCFDLASNRLMPRNT